MVVEELIAKLGFKIDGMDKVRKFDRFLDQSKRRISNFGDAANRALSSSKMSGLGALTATFLPKLQAGLKSSVSGAALLIGSLGRVVLLAGAAATGVGFLAAALFRLALGYTRAAREAASLRSGQMRDAKQQRSRTVDLDRLDQGLKGTGLPSGTGREIASKVNEKVNEAIKDSSGADAKWFRENRIKIMDKKGNQRSSAAISGDVLARYMNTKEARDKARAEETKNPTARNTARRNKLELDFRKAEEGFPGLTEEIRKRLEDIPNFASLTAQMENAVEKFNFRTPEQDEQAKRIDKSSNDLALTLDKLSNRLSGPIDQIAANITEKLLPSLNSLAQGILDILDHIPGFKSLIAPKKKEAWEKANESPEVSKALSAGQGEGARPSQNGGGLFGWLGRLIGADELHKAASDLAAAANAYNTEKEASIRANKNTPGLEAAARALQEAYKALQSIQKTSPGKITGEGAMKKTEIHNSNVGNDQRQIPISVSITATMTEAQIEAAAARGVKQAAGQIKRSIANTAGTQTP